jgi:hypothetical protein
MEAVEVVARRLGDAADRDADRLGAPPQTLLRNRLASALTRVKQRIGPSAQDLRDGASVFRRSRRTDSNRRALHDE